VNIFKRELDFVNKSSDTNRYGLMYPLLYITNVNSNSMNLQKDISRQNVRKMSELEDNEWVQVGEIKISSSRKKIKWWYLCYWLFELWYHKRYKVLTFQTPLIKGIINSLSRRKIKEWTINEIKKLLNLYLDHPDEPETLGFLGK